MATGLAQKAYKEIYEDFTEQTNIGTASAAGVRWWNSSDTGNTAFIETATADGPVARALTDTTDNDMCELAHGTLGWSVQNGELGMEARMRVTVGGVDDVAVNFGFNDDILEDSNTLPMELATTTFTSNADTWVGMVYDPDADNDDVHCMWTDDTVDASEAIADLRMTNAVPVDNEWFGMQVRLSDRGSGRGVRAEFTFVEESTGRRFQKQFNTNVDRDALLTPHIAFENRAGVAHTFDIDYIKVWQSRATT